ncbi:MAG TPA: sigma-70 family RNA polymerase sigma factor [Urbifossiella sp.]|jgi:RNA polymerase sigma factor (sigma-70 family)|nr:sigma-70 family RNA polymerase sigma factor [Urbifossiella sp.]
MSATRSGQLLRRLAPPDPDDGPLLARFAADRDPAAFAALVRRHGPLVLTVCRRVTGHPQDAEDAFQAVFLVLARKAGGLRDPGRLGNWLYGVAAKVASRARRAAARRRLREVQAVDPPDPAAPFDPPPAEIGPALHEELAALPAHYREPIVLCDLQGATRAEAAKALGVPEGTLSSRLANGRRKLADRLTRRGVVLSAAGVPAAVAEGRAAVPESLVSNTCGVVAAWAAGGAVPAAVVRLAAGGFPVKSVLLGGVLAVSLVAGAVASAIGTDPGPGPRPNPPPPAAVAAVAAVAEEEAAAPEAQPATKGPPAKGAGYTTHPRLQDAIDLPVRDGRRMVWSPAGDRLVVVHTMEGGTPAPPAGGMPSAAGGAAGEGLLMVKTTGPTPQVFGTIHGYGPERFVKFTPGNELVTARREYGLVSGRHGVAFWGIGVPGGPFPGAGGVFGREGGELSGEGGGGPGGRALSLVPYDKRFPLDPEQSDDFVFSPDGKIFTTLILARDETAIRKITVRRMSTETGKTLDDTVTITGAFRTAQLTADGKRVVTQHAQVEEVSMNPLGAAGGWSVAPDLNPIEGTARSVQLPNPPGLSRDGSRVLVANGFCRPALLDGATGKALPPLEGAELVYLTAAAASFSGDGRLMAVAYQRVDKRVTPGKAGGVGAQQTAYSAGETRLGVWDTTTGKLVRSWPGRVTAVAFHPTRPVLAVLEPNGAQTRLGLWDFSAE